MQHEFLVNDLRYVLPVWYMYVPDYKAAGNVYRLLSWIPNGMTLHTSNVDHSGPESFVCCTPNRVVLWPNWDTSIWLVECHMTKTTSGTYHSGACNIDINQLPHPLGREKVNLIVTPAAFSVTHSTKILQATNTRTQLNASTTLKWSYMIPYRTYCMFEVHTLSYTSFLSAMLATSDY